MKSLKYLPGVGDVQSVDLSDGRVTVGQGLTLRENAWNYTLGSFNLTGVTRFACEATLTVSATKGSFFDKMSSIFDGEMDTQTPGTLVVDDSWSQHCYVPKTTTSAATSMPDQPSTQQWTVILLDGVWRRSLGVRSYSPTDSGATTTSQGLDLPTDLAFDLGATSSTQRTISNNTERASAFIMTIYGPVSSPQITIGDNVYELSGSIPSGGYARISSIDRTIMLVDADGDVANIFDWGVRGSGRGGGNYIFERIAPGDQEVSWPSSFTFDLELIEERSDPTWLGMDYIR